jgi:hypothetical protein
MKDSLFSTKDIVKYLVVAGLVYTILKMIPSIQMSNKDLILVLAIITVGFIMIDCTMFRNPKQRREGFAQAAKEEDPFALDLNIDIDALLKKKMDIQIAKAAAAARPKSVASTPKSVASTPKSVAATPKSEAATPKSVAATPKSVAVTPKSRERTPRSEAATPKSRERTPRSAATPKSRERKPRSEAATPKSKMNKDRIKLKDKSSKSAPKVGCAMEVNKIKRELEKQINKLKNQLNSRMIPNANGKIAAKYFESLLKELNEKGVLDARDIENIQLKMRSKLLTVEEVISSLEMLKKEGKSKVRSRDGKIKDDRVYSELPSDFYSPLGDKISNEWDNDYTILNTNKWQVPMPRPPVCINTAPCKVCPSDSSNYPVNLKQWDDSRYVTQSKINKKWADDQARA